MKKVWIAFTLLACSCWSTDMLAQPGKKPIQTIIIDPGHGGIDPRVHPV